jgi:CheY-like chemotaxis protein
MRILVVEDDKTFLEGLIPMLRSLGNEIEVIEARSKESAQTRLRAEFFDLILLDLTIPTADGLLDLNIQHGHAVFGSSRVLARGTPVFILTGSSAEDVFPDLIAHARQVDVWGDGLSRPTVDYLPKSQLDKLTEKLKPIAEAVRALADVELKRSGSGDSLSVGADRIVRIFARTRAGSRCELAQMSAGLSDARVFRVRVFDQHGASRINAIAKIGSHDAIATETRNYEREIARLDSRATPRLLGTIDFGGKDTAAVFYSLAEGYEKTLFDLVASDPSLAAIIVSRTAELTDSWNDGVPERQVKVRDVRRLILIDEKTQPLVEQFGIGWVDAFEQRRVQTRWSCVHGDLHGGNILVNGDGVPVLIDYGDVKEGPAAIDPITLELSVLFHPDRPKNVTWPSAEQARAWGDVSAYTQQCPFAEFIKACRAWSDRVGVGPREISASAYGYLLRQLKYPDTDKEMVLTLLTSVEACFQNA